MNKFPVLIGGSPRSGTTALIQVLNSNPAVFISSEENLLALAGDLGKKLGTKERRAKNVAGGMRALSVRETLSLDNIHSHNFTSAATWPTIRNLYSWHHRQLHGDHSLILWGDKYPNYFRDLKAVLKVPKVRYLHLTRHPLDVINSMLRRTEMALQGLDWWKGITEVDDMIETWVSAYIAIEFVETNRNVLHLHYEDLIFDFPASMKRVNEFVGVDFPYKNILVSDPSMHFERTFLNEELSARILRHPVVVRYHEKTLKRYS